MSQRRKSMLMGVLTSIGAYVFPILAWGYITNGRIGTVLFSAGIILSMPGFFVMKLLGIEAHLWRVLVPIVINAALYTFVWLGILKLFERRSQDTQEQPPA